MFDVETIAMIKQDLAFDEMEIKTNTQEQIWGYIYEFQYKIKLLIEIDKLSERFTVQVVPIDKEKRFGMPNYKLKYACPVVKGDASKGVTWISRNIRTRLLGKVMEKHKTEIERIKKDEAERELALIFCQEVAKEMGLRETKTGGFAVSSLSTLSAHSTGVRLELKEYITINPENVEKINQLKKLISAIKQVKNDS